MLLIVHTSCFSIDELDLLMRSYSISASNTGDLTLITSVNWIIAVAEACPYFENLPTALILLLTEHDEAADFLTDVVLWFWLVSVDSVVQGVGFSSSSS